MAAPEAFLAQETCRGSLSASERATFDLHVRKPWTSANWVQNGLPRAVDDAVAPLETCLLSPDYSEPEYASRRAIFADYVKTLLESGPVPENSLLGICAAKLGLT